MEFQIQAGEYRATVVSEGAGLAALTRNDRDLVLPHPTDQKPLGYSGKVLVPWPNRIARGTYHFDGKRYRLPINEPENYAALHGLQCWTAWELVDRTEHAVTLTAITDPFEGYPARLQTWVTYSLDPQNGLTIRIETANIGDSAGPYGTATHPYITCNGAPIDRCTLRVQADVVALVDQEMSPRQLVAVEEANLDLRNDRPLEGLSIDHAFTSLHFDDVTGEATVRLRDPQTGMSVSLASDEPWVQVYSGEQLGRLGVAVEPMTCPPDAFNSGEELIVLAPGESHSHQLRIFEG